MDWKRDFICPSNGNVQFTATVDLKDQVWIRCINVFFFFNVCFHFWFLCHLRIYCVTETMEKLSDCSSFWVSKTKIKHFWSDRVFKGIVVNRALPSLHGGSFEITLTVPLYKSFSGQPHSTNSHNGHNHPLEHLYRD